MCTQAEHARMRTGGWVDAYGENHASFERRLAAREWIEDLVFWIRWKNDIAPHGERPRRTDDDGSFTEGPEPHELA